MTHDLSQASDQRQICVSLRTILIAALNANLYFIAYFGFWSSRPYFDADTENNESTSISGDWTINRDSCSSQRIDSVVSRNVLSTPPVRGFTINR